MSLLSFTKAFAGSPEKRFWHWFEKNQKMLFEFEKDQENIFEPFFTTSNEGSGLGLYLAQELCAVNYASLSFIDPGKQGHYFRIGFAHPERLLPRPQE